MDLKIGDEPVRYACKKHLAQYDRGTNLQVSRALEAVEYNMLQQIFLMSLNLSYEIR